MTPKIPSLWRNPVLILPAGLVVLVVFAVMAAGDASSQDTAVSDGFVGSDVCESCHAPEFAAWSDSHHGWALRDANPGNVLGRFDGDVLRFGDTTARFFVEDGQYVVETENGDGDLARFPIRYTVGVTPLQQYLVETTGGRLQALDIAWDTIEEQWFHLYADDIPAPGDGLHWTGPYKNWQARCAVCHQTDFHKGYDPQTETYHSTWADLTVGCEACHGPASGHVAAMAEPDDTWQASDELVQATMAGFVNLADATVQAETCAPCHARRIAFDGDSVPPGAPFADHFGLSLLSDGIYFADGQVDAEDYVYGSFEQSAMARAGVTCSNCHNPHSGELVADGNGVCTQCHNPQGSELFAAAPRGDFDSPVHHHHTEGSDGAMCVSCHMPTRTYMVVDPRRDHSFRIPRPDIAELVGAPDACTSCHVGQSQSWAAQTIRDWFPEGRWHEAHFGEVLQAGRTRDDAETTERLLALAGDTAYPAIVRATAIELLGVRLNPELGPRLYPFVEDDDPLVRAAAANALRVAPAGVRGGIVAPLLADPIRSVRMTAALATIDLSTDGLTQEELDVVEQARADLQTALTEMADFPETQLQIGAMALALRNVDAATSAFSEAVRMDPQLIDAWMMLARIGLATGDLGAVDQTLSAALQHNPDNALLLQSYGNVLSDAGRLDEAVARLRAATAVAPLDPLVRFDLAIALSRGGDDAGALQSLQAAALLGIEGPDYLELLALTQSRLGHDAEARATARRLFESYPDYDASPELRALAP